MGALSTFEQAQDTLGWWLEHRANPRRHRTTKRVPAEVLLEEREHLNALPERPYDDRELALRLIDSYGYVHFDGNHYQVSFTPFHGHPKTRENAQGVSHVTIETQSQDASRATKVHARVQG